MYVRENFSLWSWKKLYGSSTELTELMSRHQPFMIHMILLYALVQGTLEYLYWKIYFQEHTIEHTCSCQTFIYMDLIDAVYENTLKLWEFLNGHCYNILVAMGKYEKKIYNSHAKWKKSSCLLRIERIHVVPKIFTKYMYDIFFAKQIITWNINAKTVINFDLYLTMKTVNNLEHVEKSSLYSKFVERRDMRYSSGSELMESTLENWIMKIFWS